MKFIKLSITIFSIILISCENEDVDNQRPVISVISPANGDTLHIGEEIHFEAEFSDDDELRSYKIDIHDNIDGHNHKSILLYNDEDEHPWSYSDSWIFEEGMKESHVEHNEIVIPESIPGEDNNLEPVAEGEYHFSVYCSDAAGNESQVFIEVYLSHKGDDDHEH